MMSTPRRDRSSERYGPASFLGATVNVFIGTTISWVSCPYLVFYWYVTPMLLIDVLVAAVFVSLPGLARQLGRGLFIGQLSLPLSAPVVWSTYLVGS